MGISFGELVRRTLADALDAPEGAEKGDAFFADGEVYGGDAPSGASVHHDDHLYGEQ